MINKKFLPGIVSSLFAFSFLALVIATPSVVSAEATVSVDPVLAAANVSVNPPVIPAITSCDKPTGLSYSYQLTPSTKSDEVDYYCLTLHNALDYLKSFPAYPYSFSGDLAAYISKGYPSVANDSLIKAEIEYANKKVDWLKQMYGNVSVLKVGDAGPSGGTGKILLLDYNPTTRKYSWRFPLDTVYLGVWSLKDLFNQIKTNPPSVINPSSQISVIIGLGDDVPASGTMRSTEIGVAYTFNGTSWNKNSGSGNSLGANSISCPAGTVLVGMTASMPPSPICSSSANTGSSSGSSSSSYSAVTLSDGTISSVDLKAQPVKFENGKWTYQFIWTRGRDATGTFFVTPKSSPATVVLKVDPAAKSNAGSPATALLDPNTEYLAEYYNLPQCSKGDIDCVVIMSASFTTLASNAAPNNNSGSSGYSGNGNSAAIASLQAQIDALTALIKQLADLLSGKGISVAVDPNGNPILCTSVPCPSSGSNSNLSTLYPCTNSSNCPPPTTVNTNGSKATYLDTNFVNVFKSNPGTGLAFPIEPQLVDTWGLSLKKDGNGKTYNAVSNLTEYQGYTGYGNTPPPTDPTTGKLVTRVGDSPCWTGTTDPKQTCDTTSRFAKGDYQEVWVYGTTGRPWSSSFWGPVCDSANIKIEKTLNLPSGINYDDRCQADSASGRKIVLGTMSGSPSRSGVFKNEFKVTTTKSDGTSTTGLTRVYFKIIDHGTMDVKLYPTEGTVDTQTNTATLASRLSVSVEQTKNITTWTDIDFWAVPGLQDTSANPENFANRILIGRYTVDEGYQGCNASTAGGVGAYKFGCARWNWLVGSTLSGNLSTGDYTIYAASHLPYIDSNGSYIARLYGNCEIGFTNSNGQGTSCNGFAWGGTTLHINAALPGAVLPNSPSNASGTSSVASFSQLTIKAKRTVYKGDGSTVVTESSIGASGTDNSGSTGCVAGNDSGGVTCAGPLTTTDLKAGEKFDYEWQILVPNTKYIDARYATASTDCNVADVANSGGYWQGGEGKFCGDGSPIGGTVVRKGIPVPFTGTVNSTIVARGAVISTYIAPTDTQASFVRKCTADLFGLGGFDYNPSQGFINSAQGGYGSGAAKFSSRVLSPNCAAALRGVSIEQNVNVYIALNGGGSTYATYRMGGLNFASSCVGVLDSYLCPQSYQAISNSDAWFNRPGTCNIPNTADIANRLGLGVGNYNTNAAAALTKAGKNIDTSLLAQFNPFSGTGLTAGWAFDKAELILSGSGYSKTFDLGNSQNPKWLKNMSAIIKPSEGNATGDDVGKSVACAFSSLGCGDTSLVSSPEFTGLNPASSYTLTARFTCNGTNPAGGVNYREGSVMAVTSSLNVGSNGGLSSSGGSSSSSSMPDNVFSSSSCYVPTTYQSDLNLGCKKTTASSSTNTIAGSFNLPSTWKFDNIRLYGDTHDKVVGGCPNGPCSFENWNLKSSLPASGGLINFNIQNAPSSINPYWTRMIFDCSSSTTQKYTSVEVQCN